VREEPNEHNPVERGYQVASVLSAPRTAMRADNEYGIRVWDRITVQAMASGRESNRP
jgi:hypothetical protein